MPGYVPTSWQLWFIESSPSPRPRKAKPVVGAHLARLGAPCFGAGAHVKADGAGLAGAQVGGVVVGLAGLVRFAQASAAQALTLYGNNWSTWTRTTAQ